MGAELGRGGFAIVFQAFNIENGDFVAVKRFPLKAIEDESLGSIEVFHDKIIIRIMHSKHCDYVVERNRANEKIKSS